MISAFLSFLRPLLPSSSRKSPQSLNTRNDRFSPSARRTPALTAAFAIASIPLRLRLIQDRRQRVGPQLAPLTTLAPALVLHATTSVFLHDLRSTTAFSLHNLDPPARCTLTLDVYHYTKPVTSWMNVHSLFVFNASFSMCLPMTIFWTCEVPSTI